MPRHLFYSVYSDFKGILSHGARSKGYSCDEMCNPSLSHEKIEKGDKNSRDMLEEFNRAKYDIRKISMIIL